MANKNENEKRDSVADILAEWRECIEAADPSVWDDGRIAGLVKTTKAQQLAYLDRIEAAWKREREELDKRISVLEAYAKLWTDRADELRLKCDEFYAKAKSFGNAAATREALCEIVLLILKVGRTIRADVACGIIASKAKHALAAPARNCDLPNTTERYNEFCYNHCDAETCCEKCQFNGSSDCEAEWLLAPAAERKGEGDDTNG